MDAFYYYVNIFLNLSKEGLGIAGLLDAYMIDETCLEILSRILSSRITSEKSFVIELAVYVKTIFINGNNSAVMSFNDLFF